MAIEMRAARRQAVMPLFVLDLTVISPHAVLLSVHNSGLGPALSGSYEIRLHLTPGPGGAGGVRSIAWSAARFPVDHDRPFNFSDEGPEPWGADLIVERVQRVEMVGSAFTVDGELVDVHAGIDDLAADMAAKRAVTSLHTKSELRHMRDELVKLNRTALRLATKHDSPQLRADRPGGEVPKPSEPPSAS